VKAALAKLALAVALGASTMACGPDFERTQISGVLPSKVGGRFDVTRLEVPAGTILKASVIPLDDRGKRMPGALYSRDPSVLEIANVVSEYDYAFIGLRPGVTQIELRADGDLVLVVDAVVTAQPEE